MHQEDTNRDRSIDVYIDKVGERAEIEREREGESERDR